jgi:hypothetical protein
MITHGGRRYRRPDAIKAGLISEQVDVVLAADGGEPETVSAEVVDGTVDRDPAADAATKVVDPEVTKVREPDTAKGRGRRASSAE